MCMDANNRLARPGLGFEWHLMKKQWCRAKANVQLVVLLRGAYTQVVERGMMVFEAMLTVRSADECNGKRGCKFDVDR
jgi:hypothetical protein